MLLNRRAWALNRNISPSTDCDKTGPSVFERLSKRCLQLKTVAHSFRQEVCGACSWAAPKRLILYSQRPWTDLFLATLCIFFSPNRSEMCSHKCFPVAAKDRPHDMSTPLTIITERAAQTLLKHKSPRRCFSRAQHSGRHSSYVSCLNSGVHSEAKIRPIFRRGGLILLNSWWKRRLRFVVINP